MEGLALAVLLAEHGDMFQFIRREWAMAGEKSKILLVLGVLFSAVFLIAVYYLSSRWLADTIDLPEDGSSAVEGSSGIEPDSENRTARLSRMEEQFVLKNHIDALGGVRALGSIESIRFTGKVRFEDGTVQNVLVVKKGGYAMRVSVSNRFSETSIIISHDNGWRVHEQFNKIVNIEDLPDWEIRENRRYIHVVSELYLASVNGWPREYLGLQEFNNQMTHVFEVRPFPGHTVRFYIDPETFLNVGRVDIVTNEDGTTSRIKRLHSNHMRAGSLMLPGKVENYFNGELKQTLLIEEADVNSGILDSAFDRPQVRS